MCYVERYMYLIVNSCIFFPLTFRNHCNQIWAIIYWLTSRLRRRLGVASSVRCIEQGICWTTHQWLWRKLRWGRIKVALHQVQAAYLAQVQSVTRPKQIYSHQRVFWYLNFTWPVYRAFTVVESNTHKCCRYANTTWSHLKKLGKLDLSLWRKIKENVIVNVVMPPERSSCLTNWSPRINYLYVKCNMTL